MNKKINKFIVGQSHGRQRTARSLRENYDRGELTKNILKSLVVGGLVTASFALPNLPMVFKFMGIDNAKDRYRARRAVEALKKNKMIDIYEKDGEVILKITENGRKKVLKYQFDDMKITRPKKWDGLWRVIVYDIPESRKKARDALTHKLREMELYPFQKSGFICPFECHNEIDFVGEIFNIRKFIRYFVAKEIDDEDYLKRYYNL